MPAFFLQEYTGYLHFFYIFITIFYPEIILKKNAQKIEKIKKGPKN